MPSHIYIYMAASIKYPILSTRNPLYLAISCNMAIENLELMFTSTHNLLSMQHLRQWCAVLAYLRKSDIV